MSSPPAPAPPLTSFAPFPRLPLEIRRLIWRRALPRGRIQLFARAVPWEAWRLLPPPIARVCREARDVVLSHAVVRGFPTAADRHNQTCFVGARDVLELASGYPYPMSNPEPFFAAAETLAINGGSDFAGDIRAVVRDLLGGARFPRVRRVYLIVDQISTAFWPKFRPDMAAEDKGKGTLLDLSDGDDLRKIEEYKTWARFQEMSPIFPRLEDVELGLRASLDEVIMEGLRERYDRLVRTHPGGSGSGSGGGVGVVGATSGPVTRRRSRPAAAASPAASAPAVLTRDDPWVQEQWARLPEFRPAILVLGWTSGFLNV
ncbi:hypothetical protein F5Y15DRAFT_423460 [Xylariaceae sp. FL0016]|nr:hypothetical protein F5Y15DRAFT_423460 [Xylariaceae sp. FL0016]